MGTRCSIFKEVKPGEYYGVFRHYDGYPEGEGVDLKNALTTDTLSDHMSDIYSSYCVEYPYYTFNNIMDMLSNSDHEYCYIVYLDSRAEVYEIIFGDYLENNEVRLMGELDDVLS